MTKNTINNADITNDYTIGNFMLCKLLNIESIYDCLKSLFYILTIQPSHLIYEKRDIKCAEWIQVCMKIFLL